MLAGMVNRSQRFAELNERARRAFLEGAAEEWRRRHGRPPTAEELDRLLLCYPGDPMPARGPESGRA
jgi:hypothetical protein